jgi:hypothetical protein
MCGNFSITSEPTLGENKVAIGRHIIIINILLSFLPFLLQVATTCLYIKPWMVTYLHVTCWVLDYLYLSTLFGPATRINNATGAYISAESSCGGASYNNKAPIPPAG